MCYSYLSIYRAPSRPYETPNMAIALEICPNVQRKQQGQQ